MVVPYWGRIQRGIGSIGKSRTTTVNSNGNATDEVAQTNSKTGPEKSESSIIRIG